ncbi:MAG: cob(I)yrinic acid a,c-diamide adenosyltransferase [Candidatus Levybacteria bacterium]|nr:cob(I)yrinic acid a,c-diamide adenosyltransferase [Candidatus Levybacteria bacterium]
MKIYTRTGDKGQTSLFGGRRVSKSSLRVEAYGTVDELNSAIGVVIAESQKSKVKSQNYNLKVKSELEKIQNDLLTIGSMLASLESKNQELRIKNLELRTKEFEELIDELTSKLPELHNFILPGGGKAGSLLHFARTVCRRAERRAVALAGKEHVPSEVLIYFNRLSDLLFTMARYTNMKEKKQEIIWRKL